MWLFRSPLSMMTSASCNGSRRSMTMMIGATRTRTYSHQNRTIATTTTTTWLSRRPTLWMLKEYSVSKQHQKGQLYNSKYHSCIQRRLYRTSSTLYHYKYPHGPGSYGSTTTGASSSGDNTESGDANNHDHDHDHSHSHSHSQSHSHSHHSQQYIEIDPTQLQSPSSSQTPLLISDVNTVKYWNQTTMNQIVEFHVPRSQPQRSKESYQQRAYTIGIGGPVGSGKTATVLALCKALPQLAKQMMMTTNSSDHVLDVGVVTNDIFTQEDAEFLIRNKALSESNRIVPVETGGCPHTAIREDISSNLSALTQVTRTIQNDYKKKTDADDTTSNDGTTTTTTTTTTSSPNILLLCESGGDNLAANFSMELVDLTIYVIDVAGGDKVPRKGGPGITQSHLLVINKIDLATAVGSNLQIMYQDAIRMRTPKQLPNQPPHPQQGVGVPLFHPPSSNLSASTQYYGPMLFTSVKHNIGVKEIGQFILHHYFHHTKTKK